MRTGRILLPAVALTLLFGAAAQADRSYIVRFGRASVNRTGDLSLDQTERIGLGDGTTLVETVRVTVEADSAFGFCIDFDSDTLDLDPLVVLFGLGYRF